MKLQSSEFDVLLGRATRAARQAAAYISSESGKQREIREKEGGTSRASQIVTEVDLESQRLILEELDETIGEFELGLLTEERQDDSSRLARGYFWCIDPLDGTLPFVENVAGYSVSIALVSRIGIAEIGVVADPLSGDLYHAVRGGGAFKNGESDRAGRSWGGADAGDGSQFRPTGKL